MYNRFCDLRQVGNFAVISVEDLVSKPVQAKVVSYPSAIFAQNYLGQVPENTYAACIFPGE